MTTARVPYAVAARTLLHDSIIDAVAELARTRGWSATTMADVARAAGVSRQTVYNEFGSRPGLVEAYLTREIDALVTTVEASVREHADDPHTALREAFSLFLTLAANEPVVHVIASDAPTDDLQQMLTGIGSVLATDRIEALIPQVWPQVGPEDARLLADTVVRLAISHALVPTQPADRAAAGVARVLSSWIDELLVG